jgi:hypothetical protein
MNRDEIIKLLTDSWEAPFVTRSETAHFSGGIIKPRHLANLDAQGAGPPVRLQFGGRVAYPKKVLAEWIADRLKSIDSNPRSATNARTFRKVNQNK